MTLNLRACLAATVPFRSPTQMALFLLFQNGEVIFTAKTAAQWNGTGVAKQALRDSRGHAHSQSSFYQSVDDLAFSAAR